MAKNAIFNTVEEAIEDFREGPDRDRRRRRRPRKRGRFHRRRRENHPRNRQFHALQRPRRALRTAFGVALRGVGTEHDGGEQHFAAGDSLHRDGRPAGTGLHHRRIDPRPRRHDPCAGRSRHPSVGSGASGPCQSAACPRRGAAPAGTYRSGRRSGPSGRIAALRRSDRDHERGRLDGPPAAVARSGEEIRPENRLHRRSDRLPSARRVDHRTGRDGRHAHQVGGCSASRRSARRATGWSTSP